MVWARANIAEKRGAAGFIRTCDSNPSIIRTQ
jgi:hypothetical protein